MKKLLPLIMLLMAAPANADIVHRLSTSTQLTVDAAVPTRLGSTYSVSGNNISVTSNGTFGGLTAPSSATAAAHTNSGCLRTES